MFWMTLSWCGGGIGLRPSSTLLAVVLGLTTAAGETTGVTVVAPTVIAAAALLRVEFMVPLGHDVLPASFRHVTCARARRQRGGEGFNLRSFLRLASIVLLPATNCSDCRLS